MTIGKCGETFYAISFKDMLIYDARAVPTESYRLKLKDGQITLPKEIKGRGFELITPLLTQNYLKWRSASQKGSCLAKKKTIKIKIKKEDLIFKPRHILKASKRHKDKKKYNRKKKHKESLDG